jgi:hypothetical protein
LRHLQDARPAGGAAGGAMTMSFSAAMSHGTKLTYRTLLKSMHEYLATGRYDQKPQLSAEFNVDIDVALPFF